MRRRYLRASTVGPCTSDISDVSYYGYMPFSRQLRDIESSIRDRRRATSTLPPPVSTYWRAFSSPYSRDSKARKSRAYFSVRQTAEFVAKMNRKGGGREGRGSLFPTWETTKSTGLTGGR